MKRFAIALALGGVALTQVGTAQAQQSSLQSMAAAHAAANGVPMSLVHRVIMRESRYNPRAVSKGNYGIMQIRLATARGLGYTGSAAGLLDPNTNMTYAVKYLAGAYKVAGGNESRAVSLYASGYYYAAKRQGLTRLASYRQPAETANYSLFAPQQPAIITRAQRRHQTVAMAEAGLMPVNYATPRMSRRALRQQQQQQASLFSWTAPQQTAETRRGRHGRRVVTVTTWQNPLAGLFPTTTTQSARHLRYARNAAYTPSYY